MTMVIYEVWWLRLFLNGYMLYYPSKTMMKNEWVWNLSHYGMVSKTQNPYRVYMLWLCKCLFSYISCTCSLFVRYRGSIYPSWYAFVFKCKFEISTCIGGALLYPTNHFGSFLRYSPCKFLFLYCNQTQKKGRLKEHFLPFWILCVDVNTRINFMYAMLLGNCVDGMRDGVGAFSKRSGVSRLVFLFHSLQGMCLVGRQAGFIFFTRTNQNLHSHNHHI
jgi:hypothetical protein